MRGRLIVFEGIDGAGKSTQVDLLASWLTGKGVRVTTTRWNSSPRISKAIKKMKKDRALTPRTYATLHAADFWDRHDRFVAPALAAGDWVVADRWAYTGIARDVARDCRPDWTRGLYSGATTPDAIFYMRLDPSLALRRKDGVSYYEAGADRLEIGEDRYREGFVTFQGRVAKTYEELVLVNSTTIEAATPVQEQFTTIRRFIKSTGWMNDASHERAQGAGGPCPALNEPEKPPALN